MQRDRNADGLADRGSLDGLPQPARLVGIEQHDVGGAGADDVADIGEGIGAFVEGDGDGGVGDQGGVAGKIIQFKGLLDIGGVERAQFFELALGGAGVPGAVDVEAERTIADHLAGGFGQDDVAALVKADLDLEGLVALIEETLQALGQALGFVGEKIGGGFHVLAPAPAPQGIEGQLGLLAQGVPHRHFERGDRHHGGALVVVKAGPQNVTVQALHVS